MYCRLAKHLKSGEDKEEAENVERCITGLLGLFLNWHDYNGRFKAMANWDYSCERDEINEVH